LNWDTTSSIAHLRHRRRCRSHSEHLPPARLSDLSRHHRTFLFLALAERLDERGLCRPGHCRPGWRSPAGSLRPPPNLSARGRDRPGAGHALSFTAAYAGIAMTESLSVFAVSLGIYAAGRPSARRGGAAGQLGARAGRLGRRAGHAPPPDGRSCLRSWPPASSSIPPASPRRFQPAASFAPPSSLSRSSPW